MMKSYFDNFDEDRHINKTKINDQNKSNKIIWKSYKKDKNIDEQLKTNPNFQDKTLDQIFMKLFIRIIKS